MFSALVSFAAFIAAVCMLAQREQRIEPIERLTNFASVQAARFNQTSHEEMQLSEYTTFVKSACVSCATRKLAQNALRLQLSSLPDDVLTEIVEMALPEEASVETARQNMSNTADETGRVSVFLYYINTLYDESVHNKYKTCVLASGVRLLIGKVVAGHVTETREEVTAFKPCHCGLVYCEKCPVISQTVTQRPVYAQQTGTITWHRNLHSMLARLAAEQVGGMRSTHQPALDSHVEKGWDAHKPLIAADMKEATASNTVLPDD